MKVSIITPSYNSENHIEETIKSVLAQSYQNWELLITDDCSTDRSVSTIEEYSFLDNRIKLFQHTSNQGPAIARNNSLKNATGSYIAFLDSDDLWTPDKLTVQLNIMKDKGYAFTFTSFCRFDDTNVGRLIEIPEVLSYSDLLQNTAIATSTVILNQEKLEHTVRMQNVYYDDFVLWLELLKTGLKAHGVQKDLMRYRILKNSVSRNKLNSAKQVWLTYRRIEKLGFIMSVYYFIKWIINSLLKYRRF